MLYYVRFCESREGFALVMFNSIPFLIGFAVFLILYAFCPKRYTMILMLAASVLFLAVNSWQAGLWALGFTAVSYVLGYCVEQTSSRKLATVCSAAILTIALVTFKLLNVSMLGMSFYLFSFLSYVIDVGRGTIAAEHSPLRFASFSFFFPKYVQGPITRYGELSGQLDRPRCSLATMQVGLCYFILGFAMKVLLSGPLMTLWDGKYNAISTIGYESISTKLAWFGAAVTSLQIFLDWQAYTFMAMGIAGALGYRLPQNFNYPYIARTIGDYYRRWHMTLMRFFKDYVYIPLGGSRAGLGRTVMNVLLVWLLTSLWHSNGMHPKYLLWGVVASAAVIADPIWSRRFRRGNGADGEASPLAAALLGHIWLILLLPITVWVLWKPAQGINFILWGMTIGVCIVLERLWKTFVVQRFRIGERLEKKGLIGTVWKCFVSVLAHIWVLIPIMVTWVMFTIRDYGDLRLYLGRLFPAPGKTAGFLPGDFQAKWKLVDWQFVVGLLFCFPLPERILRRVSRSKVGSWILSVLMAALFWYTVYRLGKVGSDPMGYAAF